MGTPAAGGRTGGRRRQAFRSLNQRVFIRSLSNLVNMLLCIMSRSSSKSSQIPKAHPEIWPLNCPKLGFPLFKSKSFCPVLIKLAEYVGGHNILTTFYNQANPLMPPPELWPLNCSKLGFPLSKSKIFHPVFIKLGEYVGVQNSSTKFYNQPNPPCTPELWPLNCSKLVFTLSKSTSFHPVFITC